MIAMRNGPGCIQAIVIVVVLLFVAGLGGDTLKAMVGPWAQNALHLAIVAGLAWLIVRPRSREIDWKIQVGAGVGLLAALFVALWFFGPAATIGPKGERIASAWGIVSAIVGLGVVWGFHAMLFGGPDPVDGLLGSARFGGKEDVDALANNSGDLIVGRSGDGKLLRYDGPAHLLTIAPTRSGKGVGTLIPNLLTANRSIICIDPKGENARVTGRQRETFGPVYYLDPFDLCGRRGAGTAYNPLARLNPFGLDLAEDAMTLADALVFDLSDAGDPHWNEEAKALLAGIILYTVCHGEPHVRTLGTVRDYLTIAPDDFRKLLGDMQASGEARGLIARSANRFLSKSDREAAGVLSAAQRHTHFLDSPRITATTDRSDFSFASLKDQVATVFLILPPDRLDTYSRWLRLLLAQALTEMARSEAQPARPVLFLLDEFAALGRLQAIERAMGLMAGYGLQLWPILQDIHQLRGHYSERAGTFISNAGVLQAFGVNDFETADMLSRTMGKTTIRYETTGTSEKTAWYEERSRTASTSEHVAARNLMDPNEIMKLEPRDMLLMMVGKDPLILRKIRYFEEREFAGLHDPA